MHCTRWAWVTDLDPTWVLHTRSYRETSLMVDVFGLHTGRYRVIAKGAKRGKRNQRAVLQPFRGLLVSTRGRGDLRALGAVEDSGAAYPLAGERLACGLYLNELLMALLPACEPASDVFAQYSHTVSSVAGCETASASAPALRAFELTLLQGIGLAPDFRVVGASGEAVVEEGLYSVDAHGIGHAVSGSVGLTVSGRVLLALSKHDFLTEAPGQRLVLAALLQGPLGGRTLRSRELLAQFRDLASRPGPLRADGDTGEHPTDRRRRHCD